MLRQKKWSPATLMNVYSNRHRLVLILVTVLLATLFSFTQPVAAQQEYRDFRVTEFAQQDLDGDGQPDSAVIRCNCYSEGDRITVIDGAGNMQAATSIEEGTDMTDDLWLFDVGNRGPYQLAVQFSTTDDQLVAEIFQDQDGDQAVSVLADENGHLSIAEPGYPAVRLVALDGYWQHDGRIAANLDITVDDQILATFGGEQYRERMTNDGQPDVVIRVRGPQGDDPRSYDWRNVHAPVPALDGIYRTTLMVRERGQEPTFLPVFPWYLLGGIYGGVVDYAGGTVPTVPLSGSEGRPYGIVKPYGQSFPPVQVDWNTGQIAYVGEFIASRGSEDNWFTYSLNRIEPNALTEPDFESPFTYYDLAGDEDGVPELQVRAERMIENDPFAATQWAGRPYQQIRYSWEQEKGQGWSYKLSLLGSHTIEDIVEFPEFALKTIPYEEFPTWVVDNTWDIASFVAVERSDYRSTEGIYEWGLGGPIRDRFYSGAVAEYGNDFAGISQGLRGEFSLRPDAKVYLYFSPIDARLHLLGASSGVYTIDDERRVEYQNLNNDGYIDTWQLFEGDEITAQLIQIGETVLYAGDHQITLLQSGAPGEIFRTQPPTNNEEWLELGQQIEEHGRDFAADDLRAMFNQFQGEQMTLTGGTMRDFRFTDTGYRYVLDLQPGFDLGLFPLNNVSGPGSYVVEYDKASDTFSTTPASPASISIYTASIPDSLAALAPVDLRFTLQNSGMEDAATVPLIITAQRAGEAEEPVVISEQTVDLLGGEALSIPVSWTARGQGSWSLTARLYPPGQEGIEQTTTIEVQAQQHPDLWRVVAGGWPQVSWPFYAAALLGLITLPGAAGLLLVRRVR